MPRRPRFGFDRIRAFAQARVKATSVREVADDIGMSFSGLHSFIGGGQPYAKTREKLVTWYARARRLGASPPSPEEVDAAIHVLTQYLHGTGALIVSEAAVRRLIDELADSRPATEANADHEN